MEPKFLQRKKNILTDNNNDGTTQQQKIDKVYKGNVLFAINMRKPSELKKKLYWTKYKTQHTNTHTVDKKQSTMF